jgi:hypothetical protein
LIGMNAFEPFAVARSLSAAISKFLADKVSATPATAQALFERYATHRPVQPDPASPTRWEGLQQGWREYFFCLGARARADRRHAESLRCLASGIQIEPLSMDGYSMHGLAFEECNAQSLAAFRKAYSACSLLVAHVSCAERVELARRSVASFDDPEGQVANLTVIADKRLPEYQFAFEKEGALLRVPCSDEYEALPLKMRLLFLFVGCAGLDVGILKVDDDIHCKSMSSLKDDMSMQTQRGPYGGRVFTPGGPMTPCTFWHLGKCADQEASVKPDGLLNLTAYAAGPVYWLMPAAVNTLHKAAIINERFIQSEIYEDRAVGTLLAYYGISPQHFDFIESGSLAESGK